MRTNSHLDWKKNIDDYSEWIYGDDLLVDSIINYRHDYQAKEYISYSYSTYSYIGNNIVTENQFNWYGDSIKWRNDGRKITYDTGNQYNTNPDSVVIFQMSVSLALEPKIRYYYEIEELPGDTVYFLNTEYVYYDEDGDWSLTSVGESWYHKKTYTSIEAITKKEMQLSVYPNPCKAGQDLYLKNVIHNQSDMEVIIFDEQGRMVSCKSYNNKSSFSAPDDTGIYIVILRKEGKKVGVSKQIVN